MRLGKLTNEELDAIVLRGLAGEARPEVVQGADIGEDCCALDLGGDLTVLSTDPITAASNADMGKLSILVSCNDIASSGAEPVAALLTLLAPPSASLAQIEAIMREATQEAAKEGIRIIGGHTEITDAVNRTIVSATVVGRCAPGRLVRTGGARPGDALVMTKHAAIEGTVLLAHDYREALRARGIGEPALREAEALAACLSVTAEGRIAAACGATAMHDVTEGGVYGAAWEMAHAGKLHIRLQKDAISVLPVTRSMCDALSLDPYRLISSGSLLIAHPDPDTLLSALHRANIDASVIGTFTDEGPSVVFDGRDSLPLREPEGDEIHNASDTLS